MNRLAYALSTCFWLGAAPVAPGTFGTLGGVAIAFGLAFTSHYLLGVCVAVGALYVVGRKLGDWAEKNAAGKDPGFFVLDEVIGYLITVAWVAPPSLLTLVVGFVLFRFFDVLKPPPVRWFERFRGGDGIILDDIAAGIYGFFVLWLLRVLVLEPENWIRVAAG